MWVWSSCTIKFDNTLKHYFSPRVAVLAIITSNVIFGSLVYLYTGKNTRPELIIAEILSKFTIAIVDVFKPAFISYGKHCPIFKVSDLPKTKLFLITPTRFRLEQRADLTRLSQTLRLGKFCKNSYS